MFSNSVKIWHLHRWSSSACGLLPKHCCTSCALRGRVSQTCWTLYRNFVKAIGRSFGIRLSKTSPNGSKRGRTTRSNRRDEPTSRKTNMLRNVPWRGIIQRRTRSFVKRWWRPVEMMTPSRSSSVSTRPAIPTSIGNFGPTMMRCAHSGPAMKGLPKKTSS